MSDDPLVSIGIPAYNRPESLRRAAGSALSQRYRTLELIISDDASPDPAVRTVAEELAQGDGRVRVVRQQHNLGHAGNYQYVLDAARGEYFMWLSDDDWLDPGYVDSCLSVLRADPGVRLACGLAVYDEPGTAPSAERALNLTSGRPGIRVLRYFTRVTTNGSLFSLARRSELAATGFPDSVGGDWLLVGAMAAAGRAVVLPDVHIHRSPAGIGSDAEGLASGFGLRGVVARNHHVLVAARVAGEILTGRASYRALPPAGRVFVASATLSSIIGRFTVAGLVRESFGGKRVARAEELLSRFLRKMDAR
jgi:glycosyltransferase involved in cell wall biosynthesis